jgi:hypothetical protein
MISGAPASGKGTQCELIVAKVFVSLSNCYLTKLPPAWLIRKISFWIVNENSCDSILLCKPLHPVSACRKVCPFETLLHLWGGPCIPNYLLKNPKPCANSSWCGWLMTQYGLTHISAGDLLRAEVAAGTDAGNKAQEYMQEGKLVPNEIVVMVCIERSLCSYVRIRLPWPLLPGISTHISLPSPCLSHKLMIFLIHWRTRATVWFGVRHITKLSGSFLSRILHHW